jgi:hypothetical protein
MRPVATLAVLLAASAAVAADDKDKAAIKPIPTTDLKLTFPKAGKPTEPAVIGSADELAKNEVVGGSAAELKKQVDFAKEKLVVFAWGGSGGDRVAADGLKTDGGKTTAAFALTRGLTRDFRMHFALFAVPKDAEVKVEPAKGK